MGRKSDWVVLPKLSDPSNSSLQSAQCQSKLQAVKLSKRSCHATLARLAPELDIQRSAAWIFHDSWVFHTWRMRLPASLFSLPENLGGNQILGKMAMEIVHQDENPVETTWVRNSHWETIGSKLPCLLSDRHPASWTRSHHVCCQSWLSIGHGHFWMEM